MIIEVVSTIHNEGYKKYAYQNYKNFVSYWPKDIKLYLYSEDKLDTKLHSVEYLDLFIQVPECKEFIERNKNVKWNPPYKQKKYKQSFLKFCYKVYATCFHALNTDADYLIWMDGDINTTKKINTNVLKDYFDPNVFCYFLGRDHCERNKNPSASVSSETGLIIFNLKHSIAKDFFKKYQNIYDSDRLFSLNEVHDGYVFDVLRKTYKQKFFVPFLNDQNHAFPLTQINLGSYLEHQIGSKKWR